eukprot:scaffold40599_cov63-Phaeocystis_antarctica.AAC.1
MSLTRSGPVAWFIVLAGGDCSCFTVRACQDARQVLCHGEHHGGRAGAGCQGRCAGAGASASSADDPTCTCYGAQSMPTRSNGRLTRRLCVLRAGWPRATGGALPPGRQMRAPRPTRPRQ